MKKNLSRVALVVGVVLIALGVVSFTPIRALPGEPVSGYVYKATARAEIAIGAGLVALGFLCRKKD